jgi:VCBS repeat protein/FG-GAP repeat protein
MRPSMQHRHSSHTCACVTLVIAVGSTACSVDYALGDLSHSEKLNIDPTGAAPVQGDGILPTTLSAPEVTLNNEEATSDQERRISFADLDDDGIDDMVIASTDEVTGLQYIHLRYGGPRPLTATDLLAFQEGGARLLLPSGFSVYSVQRAGDVDGDGFDDLLIGASSCDADDPVTALLVYGGQERLEGVISLDAVAVRISASGSSGSACINEVAFAPGDLDGDGFDDLALLDPTGWDNAALHDIGSRGVYVYYGRSQRLLPDALWAGPDAQLITSAAGEYKGIVDAKPAGDLDGDGRAELIVAYSEPSVNDNRVLVVPGTAMRWSGTVDILSSAPQIHDAFTIVQGQLPLGDLDGDGQADLMVSTESGALLLYGGPNFFSSALDPSASEAGLRALHDAAPITPVGDRDGDGDDEIVVSRFVTDSAERSPMGSCLAGWAPTLLSGTTARANSLRSWPDRASVPPDLSDARIYSEPQRLVFRILPAGDLDGDGAADLITVSYRYSTHSDGTVICDGDTGALHIHYGTPFVATPPVPR